MSRPLYGTLGSRERRELDEAVAILDRRTSREGLGTLLDEVAWFLDRFGPGEEIRPDAHERLTQACATAISNVRESARAASVAEPGS